MADFVPIKVLIGLNAEGRAAYPDFNTLPTVEASGLDWAKYVDVAGHGWHYDKVSGHGDEDADSPRGQQWGMLLVPKAFADEAVAAFPECSKMTELECEDFYDNRAHAHEADELVDESIINSLDLRIRAAESAGENPAAINVLKARLKKALDPQDSAPGVKENTRRRWASFKIKQNITVIS